jgi:hypothetical protein
VAAVHSSLIGRAYPDEMADDLHEWPRAGHILLAELAAARGRVALIAADSLPSADGLIKQLRDSLNLRVASLGQVLADQKEPPTAEGISEACGSATVITDIDLLFWPTSPAQALPFLTARARRFPTIAVWPGSISAGRATYSALGRPDYSDVALRDAIILRPRSTRFPDEVPFRIERILP